MAKQSKTIRFQIAHKAAQMIAEEGINDYAFAKRKAAKFFGLMNGDALPSNDEINDAIKKHQAIFFNEKDKQRLLALRKEALVIMKRLQIFNPFLIGGVLDGTSSRYPIIQINLYVVSIKEIEYFLLNNNVKYFNLENKKFNNDSTLILEIEGLLGPIQLFVFDIDKMSQTKQKGTIEKVEKLINE
jgi:hypothetical protein